MNKFINVLLRIAGVCALAGLVLLLIGKILGGKYSWNYSYNRQNKNIAFYTEEDIVVETISLKEFDKLEVNVASMDVYISEGDEYKLEYSCPEVYVPIINEGNKSLSIKQPSHNGGVNINISPNSDAKLYYKITVPSNKKDMDFDLNSSSGDIFLSKLSFSGKVKTSSGDVFVEYSECNDVTFDSSSGCCSLSNSSFGLLKHESTSGDIVIEKSAIASFNNDLSSGDTIIKNSSIALLESESSSGDLSVYDSKVDEMTINSSSGEVTMNLNGDYDDYSFKIHTSSGDIEVNDDEFEKKYEHALKDSSKSLISVTTSSGDVHINIK